MGVYTTVAAVRAEPEVPGAAPPSDADLEAYIARAEDQLDEWLGGWPVQIDGPSAGRKIVETDIDAWRWSKLGRAATRLAARLYANPSLLEGAGWGRIKGPDFEKWDATPTLRRIADVTAPLNASGLRSLSGRAAA